MKKSILSLLVLIGLMTALTAYAQIMMGVNYINGQPAAVTSASTAQDEAQGKAIWDKLQAKQADCKNLSEDAFELLGEFFMGLMMGNEHGTVMMRMTEIMGPQGEKEIHIVMGKRLSGCNSSAIIPPQYQEFANILPLMGAFNSPASKTWDNNLLSQYGYPLVPILCGITVILVWVVLVLSAIALIRLIKKSAKKK